MKNLLLTLIITLTICLVGIGNTEIFAGNTDIKKTINVVCSPDLFDLTQNWISRYSELDSQLEINLTKIHQSHSPNIQNLEENLFLISGKDKYLFDLEDSWKTTIGRDIIVPIINSDNPFIDQIYTSGITKEMLSRTIVNPQKQTWKELIGVESDETVRYYLSNNKSTQHILHKYLNINVEYMSISSFNDRAKLISEIQEDPYAIGFCRLIDIIDMETQSFINNITILPIDRNGNNKLDFFEEIYATPYSFIRGVWIGKYPKDLVNNVYALCNTKPTNESEIDFLNWILTDGQNFLKNSGLSELAIYERKSNIEKLEDVNYTEISNTHYAQNRNILLILIAFIAAGILVSVIVRFRRNKRKVAGITGDHSFPVLNEDALDLPSGLYYDKTYTWSFMEKDGSVKMGIDDFIQHITGPITQLKIKEPGDKIKKGEPILTLIQDGKQLNIYAPVSGKIKSINDNVLYNSSLVNSSPYEKGWIYKIEPKNWSAEIQFLKMAANYKAWLKDEFLRVKDFLSFCATNKADKLTGIVLQDGGEIKDNILKDLGPEIWEDFQTNFIDTSK